MSVLLGLLKNYKSIAGLLGILVGLGALYTTYNNMKDNWYEQGVTDTTRGYERKLIEMQTEYTAKLQETLANYRVAMNKNFAFELERVKAERVIEVQIQEVLKYVDKEIEVPIACDTVPTQFSSLLNQAINSVNGNSTPTN
jgi:hypothetical protein